MFCVGGGENIPSRAWRTRMRDIRPVLSMTLLFFFLASQAYSFQAHPLSDQEERELLIKMILTGSDEQAHWAFLELQMDPNAASAILPSLDPSHVEGKRRKWIEDLMRSIDQGMNDDSERGVFHSLTMNFIDAGSNREMSLSDFLELLRLKAECSIVSDPGVVLTESIPSLRSVRLRLGDALRMAFHIPPSGLVYDVRYGVVFVTKVERLMCKKREGSLIVPLLPEEETQARKCLAELGDPVFEVRNRATEMLRSMKVAVGKILREGLEHENSEVRVRCNALLGEIEFAMWVPVLPRHNAWRSMVFGEEKDTAVRSKLETLVVGEWKYKDIALSEVLDHVRKFSGLTIRMNSGLADDPRQKHLMTLPVKNLVMEHALELMTLPLGLDAEIRDGSIVIFDPEKR